MTKAGLADFLSPGALMSQEKNLQEPGGAPHPPPGGHNWVVLDWSVRSKGWLMA